MAFFSRIQAVSQSVSHRTQVVRKNIEKTINKLLGREPLSFGIKYESSEAAGKVDSRLAIVFNKEIRRELLDILGEEGLKAVKESLEPISRTGKLKESFSYSVVGGTTVVISSNAPQAGSIATGIKTTPSIQDLMDWMLTKPEFSGMNAKERHNIAGGIQRNIKEGKSPGGNSTLRRLNPTGERAYNYFDVAKKDIERVINTQIIPAIEAS